MRIYHDAQTSECQIRNYSSLHYKYCLWKHVNVQVYSVIRPLITGYDAGILHPAPDDNPPGQNMHDDNCTYMCSQHPQHAV
jgi:hypothetical protein